jgi:hypothetical protein
LVQHCGEGCCYRSSSGLPCGVVLLLASCSLGRHILHSMVPRLLLLRLLLGWLLLGLSPGGHILHGLVPVLLLLLLLLGWLLL